MSSTQQSLKEDKQEWRCACCLQFIGQVVSFLVSNVGLLSLVVGYVMLGALVFEALEKEHELSVKRNVSMNRDEFTERLWQLTRSMSVLREANWSQMATEELEQFEKSIIIAIKERGWDGLEDEHSVNWTFAGAVFYAITVITTIGYGHVAPKTALAKIVTIFYAIVGIPLTVLCWSNLGDAMAKAFRFCYWRILCYLCTKRPNQRRRRRLLRQHMQQQQRLPVVVRQPSATSRPSMRRFNDDCLNSIYDSERFACEELSLDETSGSNNLGMESASSGCGNIDVTPVSESQNVDDRRGNVRRETREVRSQRSQRGASPRPMHSLPEEESVTEMSMAYSYYPEPYLFDYADDDDYSHKSVPLWLSFFIVLAYIVWGAYLFQDWEGWSLLDSSYFCFITLTTIGFGDLVPDQRRELGDQKLVLSSLYILVGIAMIAMSFNLVQAQVIGYFKEIGKQLGIIPDDDDQDNY